MQLHNRLLVAQGVACLISLNWATPASSLVMQSTLDDQATVARQEQQQPKTSPDMQQPDPAQPDQSASKAVVFTGTIAKDGSDFILRDSSGAVYRLDAPEKAQPFEGKSVKVTGTLEASANVLHVQLIEALST